MTLTNAAFCWATHQASLLMCVHRYDPYAADASSSAQANEDASNAYENMKGLLELAKMRQTSKGEDERGGWKGEGKLRGGWAGGKDLGMVAAAADPNAMPDSTSSESGSDDDDDDDDKGGERARAAEAHAREERERKKRKREKSEKKEKKEKRERKKHKMERKEKKETKEKREKREKGEKREKREKRRHEDTDAD